MISPKFELTTVSCCKCKKTAEYVVFDSAEDEYIPRGRRKNYSFPSGMDIEAHIFCKEHVLTEKLLGKITLKLVNIDLLTNTIQVEYTNIDAAKYRR